MSKILNTRIQQKYDKESNWATVESSYIPYNGELVVYSFDTDEPPEVKIGDGESVLEDLPFIYDADVPIPDPVLVGTYTYNGQGITPQFDVDLEKVNANIPTKINAGTYTKENGGAASFTPKTGYMWQDGTSTTKYIEWTINKATVTATITGHYQYSHAGGNVAEIYVSYSPDVNILYPAESVYDIYPELTSSNQSVIPNETCIAVSATGFNPEISLAGSGTANITLTYPATNNVNAFTTNTYSITVTGVVSSDLSMCSWQQISEISQAGTARNYWSIGDYKQIENTQLPNALAFIVDFGSSKGIMFEINAWNLTEITSSSKFYAFTKGYGNTANMDFSTQDFNYSTGYYIRSDFPEDSMYSAYSWGNVSSDYWSWSPDPLWGDLNSIYYTMGASIKPYIKPLTESIYGITFAGTELVQSTSYVTIPTAYQLGLSNDAGFGDSWSKQFQYYLNGNTKIRYGSAYSSSFYTVNSNKPVEYWVRPLRYTGMSSTYNYVNANGTLSSGDGKKSRGITPIFSV